LLPAKLTQITVYPVKSTAGIQQSNAWVDLQGLSFDRCFVLVDPKGKFITARSEPRLLLIQASLTPSGLQLTAPGMPTLSVLYEEFSSSYKQVEVWGDKISGQYCNQTSDLWFSQFLSTSCQLIYFGQDSRRQVKGQNSPLSFADGYPLLLISQASLDALNATLERPVSMQQFRPNLVVDNTEAFAEDSWQHIRIGEVEFIISKPCSRCILTTVDPKTGVASADRQPLASLKSFRQGDDGEIYFGQNLIALNAGVIHQDDKVEIVKTQAAPVYKQQTIKQLSPPEPAPVKAKTLHILFDSWNTYYQGNNLETLLEQAEAAGLDLPYACRAGTCGSCKVKLASGTVDVLEDQALLAEEKAQGYILPCSCIPTSDLIIAKD
jgi:uncharacterized protein YcbX/ferredoxin